MDDATHELKLKTKPHARDMQRTLLLVNATALGSLIRPRAVIRCNLTVSDMYMRVFGKTHQIA